jgi:hypothetical protein
VKPRFGGSEAPCHTTILTPLIYLRFQALSKRNPNWRRMNVTVTAFPTHVARVAIGLAVAFAVSDCLTGQQRFPGDHPIIPVVGTVKSISGKAILVDGGAQATTVVSDGRTEIWKGKTFHDLSPVLIGDDFSARCRADASGRLVAEVIWLNIVNFFGFITKVDSDSFEMLTNPNADSHSAYVKKELTETVDVDTLFDASAKEDLKLGRDVQMVGLDLKNGTIRATRLTVYEGNGPVRMRDGKVLLPTGPPK